MELLNWLFRWAWPEGKSCSAFQFQREFGGKATWHPGVFAVRQTPADHREENLPRTSAAGGELVQKATSIRLVGKTLHQAMLGEKFQPVRQDVRGDALRRRHEFLIALLSEEEIADHEEGPAVAEKIEREGQRTG